MASSSPTATNRRLRREWSAFGVLVLASVVMLAGSGTGLAHSIQGGFQYGLAPIEASINGAVDGVASYWGALSQIDRLRTENDALRQENETLREQLARMPAISHLNDDWTKITETGQATPYRTAVAQVIVRDITDVRPRTMILDKGSHDGIQIGNVVISAGGALVGRVQWVGPTVSQVLLLNDASAVVIGIEVQSGATGEVHGQIGGELQMDNVDASLTLHEGSDVVTAGQSIPGTDIRSPYPPGLLIGEIVDISRDANAVVQTAYLQPAVDFASLSYVLVITSYEGGIDVGTPGSSPSPSPSGVGPSPSATASKAAPTPSPSASRR